MVYTFELIKHPNVHYRDAVVALSCCELVSMLRALNADCPVTAETAGGSRFLTFECRELSPKEISYLSGHSSVSLLAEKTKDGLLRPLDYQPSGYLSDDLPEILKYKGKTSVPFTRMMINTAAALTHCKPESGKMVFFDPVCGRGTGCFCAVCAGMDAVGMEQSSHDLQEASGFFLRYLKFHHLKHQLVSRSETARKTSFPVSSITFADTKEHYQSGDTRSLMLACGDTCLSASVTRKQQPRILIADLPYGIQHAPQSGGKTESFVSLLDRSLPEWKKAVTNDGVMALSFNTLTLPADTVVSLLEKSGWIPLRDEWYSDFRHEVEQAVVRDVVFARKSP